MNIIFQKMRNKLISSFTLILSIVFLNSCNNNSVIIDEALLDQYNQSANPTSSIKIDNGVDCYLDFSAGMGEGMKATENFMTTYPQKSIEDDVPFEIHYLQSLYAEREDFFNKPRTNDNFEIALITKGTGTHYVDFKKTPVENNCLLFVKPAQLHQLDLTGEFEGYVISFSESFLSIEDQEFKSSYHTSLFKLFATVPNIAVQRDFVDMKNIDERMINEYYG